MVTDYHLTRDGQRRLAEGRFRQDEDYRLVTFKDWLRSFEWETAPDPTHPDNRATARYLDRSALGCTGPGPPDRSRSTGARFIPAQRGPEITAAAGTGWTSGAMQQSGDAERRAQLIRWHADDTSDGTSDGTGDGVGAGVVWGEHTDDRCRAFDEELAS